MEQVLAATKATLIDSLDFGGNPPVADYIQSRSQIQVFPSGGNIYSPGGVKQMRFSITTSGPFVDMSSLALQAKVTNKNAAKLTFLGPNLGTLVQEARLYLSNVEVERVPFYNRTEAMLQRFVSTDKRVQLYDEGFGYNSGSIQGNNFVAAEFDNNESRTVVWRPQALGLCQQKNYLPTAFISGGGCVIELLLVNSAAEVCDSTSGKSTDWELSDVKLLVDVVNVDPSFLTSMSKHLLNGGSLTLNPKCYSTVMYSVNSPSMQLVHARAYTRLNSFFLSFFRSETVTTKQCNMFYLSTQGKNLSLQSQIGERIIPDHRCDNLSQFWHRLMHCIGTANSSATVNITAGPYAADSFIAAVDLEAIPLQAHGSGMSTHNAQLTLDLRDIGSSWDPTTGDGPTTAFITCWYETMIEISQDGVSVAT